MIPALLAAGAVAVLLATPVALIPALLAAGAVAVLLATPVALIPAVLTAGAIAVLLAMPAASLPALVAPIILAAPIDLVPAILRTSVPALLVTAVNLAAPLIPTAFVVGISAVVGPARWVVLRAAGPLGCDILIQRLVDQVAHGCSGENLAQVTPGLCWPHGTDRGGQRYCYDESYTSKSNGA